MNSDSDIDIDIDNGDNDNDSDIDDKVADAIVHNNARLLKLSAKKIKKDIRDILVQINVRQPQLKDYIARLNGYKLIDDVRDITAGASIRWISPDDLQMHSKPFVVRVVVKDDGDVNLVYKNPFGRFFTLRLSENILFQKLTEQEKILLYALNVVERG